MNFFRQSACCFFMGVMLTFASIGEIHAQAQTNQVKLQRAVKADKSKKVTQMVKPSAKQPAVKPRRTTSPQALVAAAKFDDDVAVIRVQDGTLMISGRPAANGDRVHKGDILVTENASGAVLQLSDGSTLSLRSDTRVRINELSVNPLTRTSRRDFGLTDGRVEADIIPSNNERKTDVKVRTPRMVLSVRGTQFRVQTSKTGAIAEVVSGLVSVSSVSQPKQTFALLAPGKAVVASGQSQKLQDMPTPPAPPIPAGALAIGGLLHLPVVAGIASYRVIVVGKSQQQVYRNLPLPSGATWEIPVLPVGEYVMEIRAVNHSGVEGQATALTMSIPPEAPTSLRLQHTDQGLRVSWDPVPGATNYVVNITPLKDGVEEATLRYEIGGFQTLLFGEAHDSHSLYRVRVTALMGVRIGKAAEVLGPLP